MEAAAFGVTDFATSQSTLELERLRPGAPLHQSTWTSQSTLERLRPGAPLHQSTWTSQSTLERLRPGAPLPPRTSQSTFERLCPEASSPRAASPRSTWTSQSTRPTWTSQNTFGRYCTPQARWAAFLRPGAPATSRPPSTMTSRRPPPSSTLNIQGPSLWLLWHGGSSLLSHGPSLHLLLPFR